MPVESETDCPDSTTIFENSCGIVTAKCHTPVTWNDTQDELFIEERNVTFDKDIDSIHTFMSSPYGVMMTLGTVK